MVVTRTEVQTVSPQIPLLLFLCAQMTQKKHEILQKKNKKNTMEQGFNHLLQRLHVPVCAHLMPICDVSSQNARQKYLDSFGQELGMGMKPSLVSCFLAFNCVNQGGDV